MKKTNILIVEDHKVEMELLSTDLQNANFECLLAENGREAMEILNDNDVDVIIADRLMPEMDGLELLSEVKTRCGDVPFIMLTGTGSIDSAVASMKKGATDYIQKPYKLQELLAIIHRSINFCNLKEENRLMKKQIRQEHGFHSIVTKSPLMYEALEKAKKVAESPGTTVALFGESGVGKGILARAIHTSGQNMENRFVEINCAGIPSNLLESELFGHVKGAFTGADKDREGKFDIAQRGTIFLDEIGDMPIHLQAKLLRILQEKVYEKVGANKLIKADFRVIVATHRNLEEQVKKGSFREDLFYRINAFPITLPPLRERREDISLLAFLFLDHFRMELGKPLPGISNEAMDTLVQYHWPGNVRELKNCVERATILKRDELIQAEDFIFQNDPKTTENHHQSSIKAVSGGKIEFYFTMDENNASLGNIIKKTSDLVLQYCKNNKTRAAEILKKNRSFFYR